MLGKCYVACPVLSHRRMPQITNGTFFLATFHALIVDQNLWGPPPMEPTHVLHCAQRSCVANLGKYAVLAAVLLLPQQLLLMGATRRRCQLGYFLDKSGYFVRLCTPKPLNFAGYRNSIYYNMKLIFILLQYGKIIFK